MTNKTILIADDQPHIIELVKVSLEDPRFSIITASDGEDALTKASINKPDLILLDVVMPKLDGFEVCRRLKGAKETEDIFVILLTSKGQIEDKMKGKACGADAFLVKPFSPIKLLSVVEEHLNISSVPLDKSPEERKK